MPTEYHNPPIRVKTKDLRLADRVRHLHFGGVWNIAIVKQITADEVTLFRPYGATTNFSYTGGVICYIGIEEYTMPRNEYEVQVLERHELK